MPQGLAMLLIAFANLVLTEAPGFVDWLQRRKESGGKVTEADIAELETLWGKPGEAYFEPAPTPE